MKNAKHDMISLVHMANPMTNTGTDTMRIKVVGIGATMRMRNTMMRKRTTMKKARVMNMKMIRTTVNWIMIMRTSQTKMTRRIISLMTATGKKRKTVHIGSEGWSLKKRKKRRR